MTSTDPIAWAPPSINALVLQCLDHDPAQRPSFDEVRIRVRVRVRVGVRVRVNDV